MLKVIRKKILVLLVRGEAEHLSQEMVNHLADRKKVIPVLQMSQIFT